MTPQNRMSATCCRLLTIFILTLCLAPAAFGATATPLSVSLGFEFASGDYGTTETTDSYRVPLTIAYYPGTRLDFSLEVPFLYQSNSSTVTLAGTRFATRNPGGTGGMTGTGGMGTTGTTTSVSSSQSGIGDISLTAGYILFAESATTPMLRPLAYAKLPTADKEKGLGTGAFDFGGGLSVGKGFGDWTVYAEALYVIPGSTSLYAPDNYLDYQAAVRYQLTPQTDLGLAISGATAAFAESSDAREVQLQSSYRLSQQKRLGAYLGAGLTDASPEYTAGVYGSVSF